MREKIAFCHGRFPLEEKTPRHTIERPDEKLRRTVHVDVVEIKRTPSSEYDQSVLASCVAFLRNAVEDVQPYQNREALRDDWKELVLE